MQYTHTDFLNNYNNALEHGDTDMLHDLFIDKLSDLIVHHKDELMAGLRRLNVQLPGNISNKDLTLYVTEVLHADVPNKPVLNLLGTLMIVKDGKQKQFMNAAGDTLSPLVAAPDTNASAQPDATTTYNPSTTAGATTTTPTATSKLSGDQVSGVANSIVSALGGIFNFAKTAMQSKKNKKATGDALTSAVDSKTAATKPAADAKPAADKADDKKAEVTKKSNTMMYVGAFIGVLMIIGGIWYYKTKMSEAGASGAGMASGGGGGH